MKHMGKILATIVAALAFCVFLSGCELFEEYTIYTGSLTVDSSSGWTSNTFSGPTELTEGELNTAVDYYELSPKSWTVTRIKDYLDSSGFSSSQAEQLAYELVNYPYAELDWTNSSSTTVYFILKAD